MTYLKYLKCSKCGKIYSADRPQNLCQCRGPLLVQYDLEKIRKNINRDVFKTRRNGPKTYLVKGLISDADKIINKAIKKYGWFEAVTLKEPYRIEGKKTMGLEIAEYFNWEFPDAILYPTGGGVGINCKSI